MLRWNAALNRAGLAACLFAAVFIAGCLTLPGQTPPPLGVADDLRAQYIVSNAQQPQALAFAPDGRVFYVERRTGQIRVIAGGQLQLEPFASVPVNNAGERGLLGIALHPNFSATPRLYVFYTRSDTGQTTNDPRAVVDNRIVYFEVRADVATGSEIFVASLPTGAAADRISGRLAFDQESRLIAALGDLGTPEAAQDDASLAGKILRYNDDGSIPETNPIENSPVLARGVRDVAGLAIDPYSNAIFFIDRNDGVDHEINLLTPGVNYGWPAVVGKAESPSEVTFVAEHPDYRDPLLTSDVPDPTYAGLSVNPGTRYGQRFEGRLFFGEVVQNRDIRVTDVVLNATRDDDAAIEFFAGRFTSRINDLAFTSAGTLYVATEDAVLKIIQYPYP